MDRYIFQILQKAKRGMAAVYTKITKNNDSKRIVTEIAVNIVYHLVRHAQNQGGDFSAIIKGRINGEQNSAYDSKISSMRMEI